MQPQQVTATSPAVTRLIGEVAPLVAEHELPAVLRPQPQGGNDRKQLDRFGSCPEYDQELFPARGVYHLEKTRLIRGGSVLDGVPYTYPSVKTGVF